MTDTPEKPAPSPGQIAAAEDRAERERLAAELQAILTRLGIVLAPRPGFAARRRDRMLRPRQTREG
ncbi:hypothetical protein [Aureimonas sp. SK2]|uniref:hypothetical protein n=1 Tax=Aureimonas sp. SK2 TaxID=3015992 RepID=UPI0024449F0C|nr:hypothetical protein [Aureimonas sp. SK2]